MPVLVTAADRPVARRIASDLLAEGGEVRVTAQGDVSALRAAGAFVASATPDDEGRLEAALAQVHTLVHDASDPLADPAALLADTEVATTAARGAGVRRVVLLSVPGAAPDADDPIRRAAAAAEQRVAEVPCPTVVVRVGPIDTSAFRDACNVGGAELGDLLVAPVRIDDVAALVVAFDRARSTASKGHLVVGAPGPLELTVRDHLERVGVAAPGGGGLLGRRLPDPVAIEGLLTVLRGPWRDPDPTLVDGWSFAGLDPRPPGPSDPL
jgi:uncharacterized protein YbjT (DUF2867 family)